MLSLWVVWYSEKSEETLEMFVGFRTGKGNFSELASFF